MGFPSPAADYVESRFSLDQHLIIRPAATYFMRAGVAHYREGIMNGELLVIDASLSPCDGSLLVCRMGSDFIIKRYRSVPKPHLVDLETGRKEALPNHDDDLTGPAAVFGVITYVTNDARSGEFDDCPVL
jgi:DNA polymerase V